MNEETRLYVGFSVFPGIGPVRFKLLLDYFGSVKDAWKAPLSELKKIKLGEKLSDDFVDFRNTFNLDAYLRELTQKHISVLPITHPKYPALLKQISDAPFLLYIKGKKPDTPIRLDRTVGVVGTRKITPYGKEVTTKLVEGLVAYDCTIVSGLAYGVDAVAHKTAIDSGGKTIAVLGCGIDIIAPPSNARLYEEIADGSGAIVSEMPLGLRPNKGLFPARNRIISGLSLGIIVTEGADDSGALITARNALDQGREVFAVPGPITSPYSKGPAQLLKKGAKLVESVEDVLEELAIESRGVKRRASGNQSVRRGDTNEEQKILDVLTLDRVHIDELVHRTQLTIQCVSSTITVLEMKGMIKNYGENVYGIA